MTSDRPVDAAAVAALRARIAAVEATSQGIADQAATARAQAKKNLSQSAPATRRPTNFEYNIPDRDDWIDNPPPGVVDGEGGVDLRLVRELAAVSVRSYRLSPLTKLSTIPEAIPIFVDWLTNLESRIPGGETEQRAILRTGLLRNLIDPAARGNREAFATVLAQLRRRPALDNEDQWWAGRALETIAGKQDYPTILALFAELAPDSKAKAPLLTYLSKFNTAEVRQIAIEQMEFHNMRIVAGKALVKLKVPGVRHLIEPLLDDYVEDVRKWAKRALKRMPE